MVTVLSVMLGTAAALGLARWRGNGSSIASGIMSMPLIVPVIIYAIGAFGMFSQTELYGGLAGLALAQTALALPFVIINVSGPLARFDRNQEKAARSLGATSLRSFLDVVLPHILPGVLAGALFAFLVSFNEVILAMFLTTPATQTLPVQMWSSIRLDINPTIAAAATLLVLVSSGVMLLSILLTKEEA
jgi:putative spermidine/putrescine transport system permease protein